MAFIMVKPPDAGGKKKKETAAEKTQQPQTKTPSNLSAAKKKQSQSDTDYVSVKDPLYNWINDPSYREDYEAQYRKTFQTAFQNSPYTGQKASPFARSGYDRMSQSEIAIYNYYYAKGGKEAAERYLYNLQETLNGRVAQDLYGTVAGDTGLEMLFGAAAGVDGFESGVRSVFNFKDDYISKTPHQIASAKVRADLADTGFKLPDWLGGGSAGQLIYDLIQTGANAAPSLLISAATGVPMAGNALSGISAAGNAYNQALNEGFAKDQARGYGLLAGTSEIVLEKFLGGISAFGGNKLGKKAVQNLSNVDDALKMLGGKLGGSMLSEFREEYLQEVLDPVFRHIALKTEEEMNLLSPDALYAGFLGALFGTGVESVDAVVNGLPVDFAFIDSTTNASEYDAFADILNEPEDIENFKYLASLPKTEQEAFIESLFDEDSADALEENNRHTEDSVPLNPKSKAVGKNKQDYEELCEYLNRGGSEKSWTSLIKRVEEIAKNPQTAIEKTNSTDIIKLDNKDVREWYVYSVSRIKDNLDEGSFEEQAKQAFETRNRVRTTAREMMADEEKRQYLYKHRRNPTFEELVKSKMERKSMTREEAIQDIFNTAIKTNENVNKEFGIGGE